MDFLLQCLPQPPDWRYDWAALQETPFASLFSRMEKTQQNPAWHGEGDVWTHTRMVCEELAKLEDFRMLDEEPRQMLALAALLHDAGKLLTTRLENGVLISPHHGETGAALVRKLLWQEYGLAGTPEKQRFRETICLLIRYHTQPTHLLHTEDPMHRVRKIAANGKLCPDFTLERLCLLAEADVRGRIASDVQQLMEEIQLSAELAREAECLTQPCPFASEHTARAYFAGAQVWPQQALYDDCWGEIILLCGLPGTGKDTWIAQHASGMPVVSLDDLRRSMNVRPSDNQGTVAQAAQQLARTYLRAKQPFVWNATSLTPLLRRKQIQLFENYGAAVRIVYLETDWQENLRRNAERKYVVPESVIGDMMERLILPEAYEARRVDWLCV